VARGAPQNVSILRACFTVCWCKIFRAKNAFFCPKKTCVQLEIFLRQNKKPTRSNCLFRFAEINEWVLTARFQITILIQLCAQAHLCSSGHKVLRRCARGYAPLRLPDVSESSRSGITLCRSDDSNPFIWQLVCPCAAVRRHAEH